MEQGGDKFAAIKAAQKCLNDLKKEMERDDHQNVAFICACKNNNNRVVRGTVAGNTRHLTELLASMMEKDKDLEEVIMSAIIMSL